MLSPDRRRNGSQSRSREHKNAATEVADAILRRQKPDIRRESTIHARNRR
jgi:hypothetical protein